MSVGVDYVPGLVMSSSTVGYNVRKLLLDLGAGRNSTPIIILQQNFNCKKFKQTTYSIATDFRSFLRTTKITAVKWKIYTQSVETSYAGGKKPSSRIHHHKLDEHD